MHNTYSHALKETNRKKLDLKKNAINIQDQHTLSMCLTLQQSATEK